MNPYRSPLRFPCRSPLRSPIQGWTPDYLFKGPASEGTFFNFALPPEEIFFQDTGLTTPAGDPGDFVRVTLGTNGVRCESPNDATRLRLASLPLGGWRNYLAYSNAPSEDISGSAWTKLNSTAPAANRLQEGTASPGSPQLFLTTQTPIITGETWSFACRVTPSEYNWFQLAYGSVSFGLTAWKNFNALTGAEGNAGAGITASYIAEDPSNPGSYICAVTAVATGTANSGFFVALTDGLDTGSRAPSYVGDGASGIEITEMCFVKGDIAAALKYQQVIAAYHVIENGVPPRHWLYGAGSQYASIIDSKNWTWMHDGNGAVAANNFITNKPDDGATDAFISSQINDVTDIGIAQYILDSAANDAKLSERISNGSAAIISLTSANQAINRFVPFTLGFSYNAGNTPNFFSGIDRQVVNSGNDTGVPSGSAATYDITVMAIPGGSLILPGYWGGGFFVNGASAFGYDEAQKWLMRQAGNNPYAN